MLTDNKNKSTICDAIASLKLINFFYIDEGDSEYMERIVAPHFIFEDSGGELILKAKFISGYTKQSGKFRNYSINKIKDLAPLNESFEVDQDFKVTKQKLKIICSVRFR